MSFNRRRFLTASAFAGTWSLLAPHARALGVNDEIRVCVIGFNGRGKSHIEGLLKAKGARLVALCDIDPDVLNKQADALAKQNVTVAKYDDYRKVCEAKDIDAVVIATPNHTHCLIAMTAAANGKHVYVEKPVSHNVWEGRRLAEAQEKHKVVIQHGFQRRSETCWEEAIDWIKAGNIGKMTLARGFCYKPRPSIGKSTAATPIAPGVNYDLWCGTREVKPLMRAKLHYDWHWQSPYGNGDLGNGVLLRFFARAGHASGVGWAFAAAPNGSVAFSRAPLDRLAVTASGATAAHRLFVRIARAGTHSRTTTRVSSSRDRRMAREHVRHGEKGMSPL
jgi:hypothetical protein